MEPEKAAAQAQEDLTAGASWVIIEGRDSGVGVGVYDESGAAAEELIGEIADRSGAPERLIWEGAPAEAAANVFAEVGTPCQFGQRASGRRDHLGIDAPGLAERDAAQVAGRGPRMGTGGSRTHSAVEALIRNRVLVASSLHIETSRTVQDSFPNLS